MQFGRGKRYGFGRFYTSTIDADVAALVAFGSGQGYSVPSGSTQTALNTYVTGLKSAGIWTKLDALYVFATDGDSDFATLNLKDPDSFQCTKVNSPTFTSLEGFTGNGTSSYLNTNYNPASASANFTLNSSSFGYYARTGAVGSAETPIGVTNSIILHDMVGGLRTFIGINGAAVEIANLFSLGEDIGFLHVNRAVSTEQKLFQQGSAKDTSLVNSTILSNGSFYLLARESSGTPIQFSQIQMSVAFFGGDLSSEASIFYTLTEAYMDALGKGVVV